MVAVAIALAMSACVVTPTPIAEEEHVSRAAAERPNLFKDQVPLEGTLDLYQAMARAIKYNLDVRMRFVLERFEETQITSANLSLLPTLGYTLDYAGRTNYAGSNSKSLITGTESLEVSTSSDRDVRTLEVGLTWNILDLGISYVRARQVADRRLIAREQTRKVIHTVIRDVRTYYWQTVVAARLLPRIESVLKRAEAALAQARANEESGLATPLNALAYRADLLEQVSALKTLRAELEAARVRLLAVLSLPVTTELTLADQNLDESFPEVATPLEDLEAVALVRRPELREEDYQERINRNNVRHALLQILPGVEFDIAYNRDSNSYTYANRWWDWGSTVTGNLLDVFTVPWNYDAANQGLEMVKARRLALSMAVISQVHVSWLQYEMARDDFRSAAEFDDVRRQILEHTRAGGLALAQSDLDVVKAEVDSMVAEVRRLNAYLTTMVSLGDLFVSTGAGDEAVPTTPEEIKTIELANLAQMLRAMDTNWRSGRIEVPDLTPVAGTTPPECQGLKAADADANEEDDFADFLDWMSDLFRDRDPGDYCPREQTQAMVPAPTAGAAVEP